MAPTTHASTDTDTDGSEGRTGLRNRFFRGKQMKAEEFETEQAYFIQRRRLINRAMHGWGVVHGFALKSARRPAKATTATTATTETTETTETTATTEIAVEASAPVTTIKVGRGLALDRHGREIVLTHEVQLDLDNVFVRVHDKDGWSMRKIRQVDKIEPGNYVLGIHFAERRMGDAPLPQTCGCAKPEKRFVCETVVFSLEAQRGKCPCGERDCKRICECGADKRCSAGRGPHACLCKWVTAAEVAGEPTSLCEWNGLRVDPGDRVMLACVEVAWVNDKCAPIQFKLIEDDCSPRRLVKSNDLLYDLLRGCDLTKIEHVSWAPWHRADHEIPWTDFLALMNVADVPKDAKNILTGLEIRFTRPVDIATLLPDCFALKFMVASDDSGWRDVRFLPVSRVDVDNKAKGNPPGTTRAVKLEIGAGWGREVSQGPNVFSRKGARMEIEIHGDFILDCHGQAIDANARGLALRLDDRHPSPEKSGNGSPGGTFRSLLRIGQCPASEDS